MRLVAKAAVRQFLGDPRVEPKNNVAERALQPAVLARKVSQGPTTERGAEAHSGFLSVIRTLRRRKVPDLIGASVDVFQTGALPEPV
jgi:transposase